MCATCGRQVQAASVSRKCHTRITPASFHYSPLQAQGYWTSDVFRRPGVRSRAEAREAHSAPADERTAAIGPARRLLLLLHTPALHHGLLAERCKDTSGYHAESPTEPTQLDFWLHFLVLRLLSSQVGRDSMTLSIGNSANDIETCSGYHMMAACTFDAVRSKNPQLHSRTSTQRWHTARLESGSSRQTYFEFGQRHAASPNTHAHPASRKFWINILITAGEAAHGVDCDGADRAAEGGGRTYPYCVDTLQGSQQTEPTRVDAVDEALGLGDCGRRGCEGGAHLKCYTSSRINLTKHPKGPSVFAVWLSFSSPGD
ncbi:hypothetical protein C8J57DRAFT_1459162 [Mycena rebaudengoi]|nr:hypothetical protein C8J57DRAFT_1459162 [Mycena rebaudengoi]